jgi:PAS domain S-box-containing protein
VGSGTPAEELLPLQALLRTAPDGMLVVDGDGIVVAANDHVEAMFGYGPGELEGASVERLVPAAVRGSHPGHRVAFGHEPRKRPMGAGLLLHGVRKDGSEFGVDIALGPIRLGSRDVVVASVRDMTERSVLIDELRRARDQADAANRAKSEFLSRMSHELRTPLNAILGFAQLLGLDDLSPDQRESVGLIRRAGGHLLDLINEVLDISRVESGKMALSVEPVLLRQMVEESLELVRAQAVARGVTVAHVDLAGCTLVVRADAQRLKQVLVNLLSNAVKYNCTAGRIDVEWEQADGRVKVRVRDTGPGIPPELRHRLFVPFDRLGAEHSGAEGSGVGLALSRRLAEAMGGALTLDPDVVSGASFVLELQAGEVGEAVGTMRPGDVREQARATVLYIEDNLSNLRLVERIVARRGTWRLVHALQGRLGFELAVSQPPQLLLLDLHLPDLPGERVLAALRADPRTADVPVYVISADATPGQRRRLLQAGAAGYLTKPIDVRQLLDLLDTHDADPAD